MLDLGKLQKTNKKTMKINKKIYICPHFPSILVEFRNSS